MPVNWLDIVLVVIVLISLVFEYRRGFGRAVFDLAAVILSFLLAKVYYTNMVNVMHPFETADANQALGFAVLFLPSLVILFILADMAYNSLLVSTDVFERLLGTICGLLIGIGLAHALAFWIWLGTGRDLDRARVFTKAAIADEILTFHSYHSSIAWLASLGQPRSQNLP